MNMRMPKCPKTVTGKHKILQGRFSNYLPEGGLAPMNLYYKQCVWCGLIDDRKVKKKKII